MCKSAVSRSSFDILPGDNITIRLVVNDSEHHTVHVYESITKALEAGKIGAIDVGISYRCLEVNTSQSHYSRENV